MKNLSIKIFVALLLFLFSERSFGQKRPMNVLFIAVDDMRPATGSYGDIYAKTPHIDQLSKEGITFDHAYCQQAVCNPSRASILTGRRPDETGVVNLETHFRTKLPTAITLPQLFKNNGYQSICFGKVFHADPKTLDPVSWNNEIPEYKGGGYVLDANKGKGKQNSCERAAVADEAYEDGKISKDAVQFITTAKNKKEPFFLAVGFKKPHAPYTAPEKYWKLYDDIQFKINDPERPVNSPDLAFHNLEEIKGYKDVPDEGPISPEKEQQLIQGYYACISYMDAQVGKVMKALEANGLKENTIVVFWGDHGYHLGEQTSWCKSTNFELDARVPLIISAPGFSKAAHSEALVELVDVYPTLADLCNIPTDEKLSGISLKPLLSAPDKEWGYVSFNQFVRPYKAIRKASPTHMGYSVRTKNWRCTYWYELSSGKIVEKELYDLKKYQVEKKNLSGVAAYAKLESDLAALIDDYRLGKYSKAKLNQNAINY